MLPIGMGATRHEAHADWLVEDYVRVRAHTEALAEPLSAEDQSVQSMPDASPTKWHRAHTTWFFETFVLVPHFPNYQPFHPAYEVLFNSYYNSVGSPFPRPQRGLISRPGVEEVRTYREYVDDAMRRFLPSAQPSARELTVLGLHHEQQHQELLLTDIKHALSQNPLDPVYIKEVSIKETRAPLSDDLQKPHDSPVVKFIGLEGGRVRSGFEGSGFHYDNETPAHDVLVDDFEIATRPLSNAHVLEFIQGGGYLDPLLWLSDGWAWLQTTKRDMPAYWRREEHMPKGAPLGEAASAFSHFTLHGQKPIVLSETACHLSYFEADALARFFGARLPTEHEWEHAARAHLAWGGDEPGAPRFDQGRIRPGSAQPSSGKLQQLFGGVWEWTQSAYGAYPGYRPAPGAVGEYNGKFMHNQMVLRGGSCATPDGHLRVSYRNFFPSSATFQFSGVRIVQGVQP